jgi:hypothetical protein
MGCITSKLLLDLISIIEGRTWLARCPILRCVLDLIDCNATSPKWNEARWHGGRALARLMYYGYSASENARAL